MKLLKKIVLNILIWVVGIGIFTWWLMWDLEQNPITPNPDGSISDSAGIPIAGFAFTFLIFIFVVNIILWAKSKFFSKQVT